MTNIEDVTPGPSGEYGFYVPSNKESWERGPIVSATDTYIEVRPTRAAQSEGSRTASDPKTDEEWANHQCEDDGTGNCRYCGTELPGWARESRRTVQVAQYIDGSWVPTPARYYPEQVISLKGQLVIDYGQGWNLSLADTAAFAAYARKVTRPRPAKGDR